MEAVLQWLLDGDPAIRWQVQRDLLDAPEAVWRAERQRTVQEGWGARLLAEQAADGVWGGGLYSPKWISSTYTLLLLAEIGIPADCPQVRRGTQVLLDGMLGRADDPKFTARLAREDRCIVGMELQLAASFLPDDERIPALVQNLLDERMPDGGWNCRRGRRPEPAHSSFHTTFNVLEGLRAWLEAGEGAQQEQVLQAEAGALAFMLEHRLFRSHQSGEVISPKFLLFSHPARWYYDVLRGLSYFARAGAPQDARLGDAMDELRSRRKPDGSWAAQNKHAGKVFFDMEKTGAPSRWNTLRALRVLKWWSLGLEAGQPGV